MKRVKSIFKHLNRTSRTDEGKDEGKLLVEQQKEEK